MSRKLFTAGCVVLILLGLVHMLGHASMQANQGETDAERQMLTLMRGERTDMGLGFVRSMSDIVEEQLAKLLGTDVVPLPTRSPSVPRLAKEAAKLAALPVTSVKTAPRPAVAAKVVRAVAPAPASVSPIEVPVAPVLKSSATGRPAPTPAEQVVAPRVQAPKNDYRNIRF